jgi:hypothetical protein
LLLSLDAAYQGVKRQPYGFFDNTDAPMPPPSDVEKSYVMLTGTAAMQDSQ